MGHAIDRRLLAGADPGSDEALRERANLLVDDSYRKRIATGLRRLTEFAREPRAQSQAAPVSVQSHDILEAEEELLQLAEDLETTDHPRPRGIILASELVTDGASPVYAPRGTSALRAAISHAHAALFLG
jgi:hypothetical protein